MTDEDKKKVRDRKRLLRRMARESILEKSAPRRMLGGLKEGKRNVVKPTRPITRIDRVPNYGQPVKLELPSLGNRIRGRIAIPTISREAVDAIRRHDVERMAQQSADLAVKLATEAEEKKDDTESEAAAGGAEGVGPTQLRD